MCEEAGVKGNKTNHSLRVAGTSAMFDAGVPERIIQGRTGHKSIEALRIYERVTEEQEAKVSKILSGSKQKFAVEDHPSVPVSADVPVCTANMPDVSPQPPSLPDVNPQPIPYGAAQYYNCTVNMFQQPPISSGFPPWNPYPMYPPIYPTMPSTAFSDPSYESHPPEKN